MKFIKKFKDEFNKLEWPRLSQLKKYKLKKEIEFTSFIIKTIEDCFVDLEDCGFDLHIYDSNNICSVVMRGSDFSNNVFIETLRFAIPYLSEEFNIEIMSITCAHIFNVENKVDISQTLRFDTLENFLTFLELHTHMYKKNIRSVSIFLH